MEIRETGFTAEEMRRLRELLSEGFRRLFPPSRTSASPVFGS